MVFRSSLVVAMLVAGAVGESMWGPADSIPALDVVIQAVDKLAKTPGFTQEEATHARQVAVEVKKDIEEVENNKTLTKAQAHEKVGKALKELTGLQSDMSKARQVAMDKEAAADAMPSNITAIKEKMAEMQKELADKKGALEKDESMIKLYNLQKELIEKKLKLQKLLDQRSKGQDVKAQQAEQGKQEAAMVKDVLSAASNVTVKSESKDELPAKLQAVLVNLKGRESKLAEEVAKEAASENKYETALNKELKELPSKAKTADLAKGQHMIKSLLAEEKRKFRKAEASKKIELNEIKEAEATIEKRDLVGLKKVMSKMQTESKALQAKSGDFLH